jgi:uncharacterized short protein YbdD (DUF466 family)
MWSKSAIGYRLSAIGRAVRKLFGMPDYQAYLEHSKECHADRPALSEKDFVKMELERKYAGGGGRCC